MTRTAAEPVAIVDTEAETVAPPSLPAWQLAVVITLAALLYYPVVIKLVRDWWADPNFSHGFLVPLFSGFIVWNARVRLRTLVPKPSWAGLAIIAIAIALLVVGTLAIELAMPRVSLVLFIGGLVVYFLGWSWFRAVFFAWICLFLMIPVPGVLLNQITFPLQLLASSLATDVLQVLSVPVFREGNIIHLATIPLEVAEACSGIRSLMTLMTTALFYGYFLDSKNWRRALLVIAAVPIAIVANAVRIVGTAFAVQYWGPERALGFFHVFSGWVIFIFALLLLFIVHTSARAIGSRLSLRES